MYPNEEERFEMTPEQSDTINKMAVTMDRMDKNITELSIVIKGYNGFKGIAKTVQEHSDTLQALKTCLEPLGKIIPEVEDLQKNFETLKNKPGNTALTWLKRIMVAVISAAALTFFTLWADHTFPRNISSMPPSPSSTQKP